MLEKAVAEEKTCKDEYNCILEESRDPYFRSEVGIDQLNIAKSDVKRELAGLESKRKYLESDVKRLNKSIGEMSVSQEGYADMIKTQGEYLNSIAAPPRSEEEEVFDFATTTESQQIPGAFDESPEIKRIERSSAKFQTAEQESILRKLELSQVKISETASESPAEDTHAAPEEHHISTLDKSMFEKSSSDRDRDSSETALSTPVRPRRGSVLLSANKNVLDTLNNMFSPSSLRTGGGDTPHPMGSTAHRNSIFSPTAPPGGRRDSMVSLASEGSSSVAVEKKAARSKTLKVCGFSLPYIIYIMLVFVLVLYNTHTMHVSCQHISIVMTNTTHHHPLSPETDGEEGLGSDRGCAA